MLATKVAMRRIDGRLEEAGLMVAPPTRVLWGITLPLAAPAVVAAALMIFVLAISEFGVRRLAYYQAIRKAPGSDRRVTGGRAG